MNSDHTEATLAPPEKVNNTVPAPVTKKFRRITAAYEDGEYRFRFYCVCCNKSFSTGPIQAESIGVAYTIAEREAIREFNGCWKCYRWVCDRHYNMDEMACVKCVPRERKNPMIKYPHSRRGG